MSNIVKFIIFIVVVYFNQAFGRVVSGNLLYLRFETVKSARISSLGNAAVSDRGRADLIFLNPASLISRNSELDMQLFNSIDNSKSVLINDYYNGNLAGILEIPVWKDFYFAIGGGLIYMNNKVPVVELGRFGEPLESQPIFYREDAYVSAFSIGKGKPNQNLTSLGISICNIYSSFNHRKGTGSFIDVGTVIDLMPDDPIRNIMSFSSGMRVRYYFSRRYRNPHTIETPDHHLATLGYKIKINSKLGRAEWYTDMDFYINNNLEFEFSSTKIGLQISPLNMIDKVDLIVRSGFKSSKWTASGESSINSGVNYSIFSGLGVIYMIRGITTEFDLSYNWLNWNNRGLSNYDKILSDLPLFSIIISKNKL